MLDIGSVAKGNLLPHHSKSGIIKCVGPSLPLICSSTPSKTEVALLYTQLHTVMIAWPPPPQSNQVLTLVSYSTSFWNLTTFHRTTIQWSEYQSLMGNFWVTPKKKKKNTIIERKTDMPTFVKIWKAITTIIHFFSST